MKENKYWLGLSGITTLLAGYLYVVYGENYNLLWLDTLLFILSFSFPLTLFVLFLERKFTNFFGEIINFIIIIICVAPFYYILTESKSRYRDFQLKNYGIKTYGLITGHETEHTRGADANYSTFDYECDSKKFTQRVFDKKLKYKIGDTIMLLISTNNPYILTPIETERN